MHLLTLSTSRIIPEYIAWICIVCLTCLCLLELQPWTFPLLSKQFRKLVSPFDDAHNGYTYTNTCIMYQTIWWNCIVITLLYNRSGKKNRSRLFAILDFQSLLIRIQNMIFYAVSIRIITCVVHTNIKQVTGLLKYQWTVKCMNKRNEDVMSYSMHCFLSVTLTRYFVYLCLRFPPSTVVVNYWIFFSTNILWKLVFITCIH